jgi:hypothetical protein
MMKIEIFLALACNDASIACLNWPFILKHVAAGGRERGGGGWGRGREGGKEEGGERERWREGEKRGGR